MAAAIQEEAILKLYDSYWFEQTIFNIKAPEPHQVEIDQKTKLVSHTRSTSEQNLFSNSFAESESDSPKSVLRLAPKLQPILSGKEAVQFVEQVAVKEQKREKTVKNKKFGIGRKIGSSKSLTALEFEELKGFMDLGFVFSEKDRDSSLSSIIPGLQRLGREDEEDASDSESVVRRPYLSEAWEYLDQRREVNPLTSWRIPALGNNDMDMKDQLKFWAHAVASAVR